MTQRALLGLDVGTSAAKAIVLGEDGSKLAQGKAEYQQSYLKGGWVELDLSTVWSACRAVITECTAAARARGGDVAALSLSVSGDEATPVGKDGRHLRPTIMAMDSRTAEIAGQFGQRVGRKRIYDITGLPVHAMHPLVRLMWLRDNEPATFRKTAKMLCWSELIACMLGAPPVSDYSVASRTMAFDISSLDWSAELLEAAGIDADLLPGLAPSGSVIGDVGRHIGTELGLTSGTKIVAGGFDQAMAALGSGVIEPGDAGVGTGSWEAVVAVTASPALTDEMLDAGYPFGCYVLPGRYFCLASNSGGGSLLRWSAQNLCADALSSAQRTGSDPFELILSTIPAEPTGLIVLPHFQGSYNPWMDPDAAGAVIGMTLSTTRDDLVKAVLEGITFELRANVERIAESGIKIAELRATGGGARSAAWLQLKADVSGLPVHTINIDETGCFAAACLAGVGLGLFGSAEEPVRALVRTTRTFEPRAAHKQAYDAIFADYIKLFQAVNPVSQSIAARRRRN